MSLTSGMRLGPYQVVSSIGAGGMGEVYRARDTRLDRDVAIKVLPESFAHDADRVARFVREAKTLAALSHPNIAGIYGIEDAALVMELVEGDDLSQRLARGPIPLDDALPIARQIAEALEAAHDLGIVHRDLKPANIKVRPDGTVKVLDFGLAKAMSVDAAAVSADAMNSPTMASPAMTQLGFIIGTAAYMAPEQARGKLIDRRADIWAFGCVLYEMLTGRRVFAGDEISDVLAAVLRQEIDFTALPADVPPAVLRLLRRCLDRDPKQRQRDVGEARLVLSSPLDTAPAAAASTAPSGAPRGAAVAWAGAGLVAGAALWALVAHPRVAVPNDAPGQITLRRLTQVPGPEMQPDISPDGRQILYSSRVTGHAHIYLLRVGGARAIDLSGGGEEDDEQARFSPSGDQIAFRSSRDGGGLFVMGATGESVRRVTSAGYDPAWSPDGRSIAYSTEAVYDPYSRSTFAQLWTVDVATGKTAKLYAVDAVQPAWSPDGTHIAFWANTGGQRDIWTIAATGGEAVAITSDAATDWSPEWSPDGRWLYFESDRGGSMDVWRIPIDQGSGRPTGEAQPITSGVRALGYARFAHDGTRMVAIGYDRTSDISVAPFDPSRPDEITPRTTLRNHSLGLCHLSPDGAWIACSSLGAQEDLIVLRSDGTETRRLTDDLYKDREPTWSPDGKTLGFYSTRSGRWEEWAIQVDGSGLRQLTDLNADLGVLSWAPDGKHGIASSVSTHTVIRIDTTRLNTTASAEPLRDVAAAQFDVFAWSPSGRYLAGRIFKESVLMGTPGIWDLDSKTLRKIGREGSVSPNISVSFLPDSRRLLLNSAGDLMLIDLGDGTSRRLRSVPPEDYYRLSRDGRTLLIEHPVLDSDVWLLEMKR